MYEHVFHYFGLRENPFGISPDPRFYVSTLAHEAALAELVLGVTATQNFTILTGEAGTGKTILLNHFLNWLATRRRSSAYVFHPRLKVTELLDYILRDFGVPHQTLDRRQLLETLSRWLIGRHSLGDTPIVVVDEAQAISIRTLDKLRLLLNLSASGKKLLQIVLVGQPELLDKLNRLELRSLRKRVTCQCSLEPFSIEETSQYVKERLTNTGAVNPDIFSQDSLEAMHGYARGIPRTLNLLCEQALIAGYAAGARVISPEILRQVAGDFELTPQWADPGARETSSKFTRLLTLVPENAPEVVAPVGSKVETNGPTMTIWEPTPEIPVGESGRLADLEPTLVTDEPEPQMETTAVAASAPIAATLLTPPRILKAEHNPLEKPEFVVQTAISARSLRTRSGEQWLRRWDDIRASLTRGGAQLSHRYSSAMRSKEAALAAIKDHWAGLLRSIAESAEKFDEQWIRQRKDVRASLTRVGAQLSHRYSSAMRSKDAVLAAIKDHWAGLLRNIAESTKKFDEQWIRQRKDIRASLTRVGAQLSHRYSSAMRSKEAVLAAIKDHWAGLLRDIAESTKKFDEQWIRQRKAIRASLTRGGAQLSHRYSSAMRSKEAELAAIKDHWAGLLRSIAESAEKFDEQWIRQRKDIRASLTRGGAQLSHRYSSAMRSKEAELAAIKDHWAGLLRSIAESAEKFDERWIRQRKDIRASLTRVGAQLSHRYSLAMRSKDAVLAAIKKNWTGKVRKIAEPSDGLKQVSRKVNVRSGGTIRRFASYSRAVGDSFIRDCKQLINKNKSPKPGSLDTSAPNVPRRRPTTVKLTENMIHRAQANLPVVKYGTKGNVQFASRWKALQERFLSKSTQFIDEPVVGAQAHQRQLSPTQFEEVERTMLQGERFVRYLKEVRASFLRDWNQLISAHGSAEIAVRKRR